MNAQAKAKRIASSRNRATKRTMTSRESSDLLESASQALAMIKGSRLVGGRISVRQIVTEALLRNKKK